MGVRSGERVHIEEGSTEKGVQGRVRCKGECKGRSVRCMWNAVLGEAWGRGCKGKHGGRPALYEERVGEEAHEATVTPLPLHAPPSPSFSSPCFGCCLFQAEASAGHRAPTPG